MTRPVPKVSINSSSVAYLVPFAKRELERFREVSDHGHKRFTLPSGEIILMNWSEGGAHIRISGGVPEYIFSQWEWGEIGARVGLQSDLKTWVPDPFDPAFDYLHPSSTEIPFDFSLTPWSFFIPGELQSDSGYDLHGGDIDAMVNDVYAISQAEVVENVYNNTALFSAGEEAFGRMLGMSKPFTVTRDVAGVPTEFTQCLVGYLVRKDKTGVALNETVANVLNLTYDRTSRVVVSLYEHTPDTPTAFGTWTEQASWDFALPVPDSDFVGSGTRGKYIRTEIPPVGVLTFNEDVTVGVALLPITIYFTLFRSDFNSPSLDLKAEPASVKSDLVGSFTRWFERKMQRLSFTVTRASNGGVLDVDMSVAPEAVITAEQRDSGARPIRSPGIFYADFDQWRLAQTFWKQTRIYV